MTQHQDIATLEGIPRSRLGALFYHEAGVR